MPRVLVWATHLALPLAGLWLLLARPGDGPALAAPPEPLLAGRDGRRGQRRARSSDERRRARRHTTPGCSSSRWCSWPAPVSSSLHALATPRLLIAHANAGFDMAHAGRPGTRLRCSRWCRRLRLPPGITRVRRLRAAGRPGAGCCSPGPPCRCWTCRRSTGRPRRATSRGRWSSPSYRRGRALPGRRGALLPAVPARARRRAAEPGHRVRAAGRGDGGGDPGRQVAPVVVGVAPAADRSRSASSAYSAYVQYRREGTQRRPVRRHRGCRDHPPDPGRVRDGAGGAGHRAAGARGTGPRPAPRSPRGWPSGSASPRADRGARPGRRRAGHRAGPVPAGSAPWSTRASRPGSALAEEEPARRVLRRGPAGVRRRPRSGWSPPDGSRGRSAYDPGR